MKNIKLKISIGLMAVALLLFPVVVFAQTPATSTTSATDYWGCDALKAQIDAAGGGRASQLPQYCTEGAVYSKIVYWLYYILGIGAVIMIIYGGYLYMTAGSSEAQTKKGKTIIMYTLAGVAVAILATAIIMILVNLVVDNKLF